MSKAKQILLDLDSELKGQLISDVYNIGGKSYTMRLLTESEAAWVFSHVNSSNTVSMTLTSRLATLSVGIREIDGCTISEIFEDDIKEIEAKRKKYYDDYDKLTDDYKLELSNFLKPYQDHEDNYLPCKLLFEWLGDAPSTYIQQLFEKWQDLVKRQVAMQEAAKKSLQGSSDQSSDQN